MPWPFGTADLFGCPLLAALLILHATGISSIDHGCRSVCRCLHRSVSLITHSRSSAGLLISPRPLSLLSLPPPRPLAFSFHSLALFCFLTHIFLIRQKKYQRRNMNIHKETALICTIMQISMQLSLVSPESLDSISA